jgi:hypothetical protein
VDEHLALIRNAIAVFEHLLAEQFLESIISERIVVSQGSEVSVPALLTITSLFYAQS